jgi:hypothetical protein
MAAPSRARDDLDIGAFPSGSRWSSRSPHSLWNGDRMGALYHNQRGIAHSDPSMVYSTIVHTSFQSKEMLHE